MALPAGLAIAGFVLSAMSTIKGLMQGESEEQIGIPPASGVPDLEAGQIDMSELSQFRQQVPEYGAGGSTFGQAMEAFQPMRLSDVLRPQISLGEGQFSLGKKKRRFQ